MVPGFILKQTCADIGTGLQSPLFSELCLCQEVVHSGFGFVFFFLNQLCMVAIC